MIDLLCNRLFHYSHLRSRSYVLQTVRFNAFRSLEQWYRLGWTVSTKAHIEQIVYATDVDNIDAMHKSAKSAVAGLKNSRAGQNDVEPQRQKDRIKQLVRFKAPTTAAVANDLLKKTRRRNTEPLVPRVMSLKILIRHADKMMLLE
ncbi:hypothetical protein ACKVWC_011397 [Pyricularia oryzae]